MSNEAVQIHLEFTPNPNSLKFATNRQLLERGAANFQTADSAQPSPLARKLFAIPGIEAVMIGTSFVTITKSNDGEWETIAEEVPKTLQAHLDSGEEIIDSTWLAARASKQGEGDGEIEQKIREVLDNEIRTAVAMDGGDIVFDRYEEGIVYLHLQGSCSSCPSSVATLKMGVETRLREVVPQIREVVQV